MPVRSMPSDTILDARKSAGRLRSDALRRMEMMANLLDNAFVVPGTKQRVGIDAFIGLVPGIGDIVTTVLSSYVIWSARNLGASRVAIARMLSNLAVHATIGSIPVIGDVFDAFFRVNKRNMKIVREQLMELPTGVDGKQLR